MTPRQDPLDELRIPDGTTVEEHDVVTDGDILIGSNSTVDFGLRGRTIAAGERVEFGRQIEADGDCRLDMWCKTDGSVLAGEDAYIGERVEINGQLLVSGDLDIGDEVSIEEGFEANGWIVTRNPVPVLVFYFMILSQLLRMGDTDQADEFASALAGEDIEEKSPLVLPRGSTVSDDAWRVSTPARIGDDCRLNGNIRAESITIGEETTVFGSLRARDDIDIDAGTVVIGDVTTRGGTVTVASGAHIRGDVACDDLVIYEGAEVDGTLRARGEMKLVRQTDDADDTGDESADDEATEEDTASDDAEGDGAVDVSDLNDESDADQTGLKMAYTAGSDDSDAANASDDASDSGDPEADEQPDTIGETGDSVGAAYTVGTETDADEPTVDEDADDEFASDRSTTVGAAYLVTDGNVKSDDDVADDEAAADGADADTGEGGDETCDGETVDTSENETDGNGDDAVIITDAESDDIALENDGGDTDPDATDADS